MMPEDVNAILSQIAARWPEKRTDRKAMSGLREAIQGLTYGHGIVSAAVAELCRDPKAKFPSPASIRVACDNACRPTAEPVVRMLERAKAIYDRHGRDLLAIRARRAEIRCEDCAEYYCARGVDPDDTLLWHQHFTSAELDASTSLQAAIDLAQHFPSGASFQAKYRADSLIDHNPLRDRTTHPPSPDDAAQERIVSRRRFETMLAGIGQAEVRAQAALRDAGRKEAQQA